MNTFQQILSSAEFGIGLLDKHYKLLYCNSNLRRLLNNSDKAVVGEDVYSALALTTQQTDEVRTQLETATFWEGVISWSEKAIKAKIYSSDFAEPISDPLFRDAEFIITLADYSNELKQQRELVEAKRLAEKSEKAKSEFLSNMTHELRTPLNAILGFSQLMEIDPTLSEEQQDNLKEITSASDTLLTLINETLELSRAEPGKLKLTNETVYLKEVFQECFSLLAPLATKHNINIQFQDTEDTLLVDRIRLKQVLLNLISNAIKYNTTGGQVSIKSLTTSGDRIHIEVLDSGKGIAPQFISSIFSPFEHMNLKQAKIPNSGIGLMLTRRLVKMMGGEINVVSEPSVGSIFWIELPTKTTLLNRPEPSTKVQKVLCSGFDFNNTILQDIIKLRPELEFHTVKSITDMDKLDYNLILFNAHNKESLTEACEQLINLSKVDNSLKEIPVIAVISSSSHSRLSLKNSALISEYINKPLNIIYFISIIDRYLYT